MRAPRANTDRSPTLCRSTSRFALAEELHLVLPDDVAAAHRGDADLPRPARSRGALARVHRLLSRCRRAPRLRLRPAPVRCPRGRPPSADDALPRSRCHSPPATLRAAVAPAQQQLEPQAGIRRHQQRDDARPPRQRRRELRCVRPVVPSSSGTRRPRRPPRWPRPHARWRNRSRQPRPAAAAAAQH